MCKTYDDNGHHGDMMVKPDTSHYYVEIKTHDRWTRMPNMDHEQAIQMAWRVKEFTGLEARVKSS